MTCTPEHLKRRKERRRAAREQAKSAPCADCGVSYPPYVMTFDHLDAGDKNFDVSHGVNRSNKSMAVVLIEIAKCDVICSNCHKERTHQRSKMEACA